MLESSKRVMVMVHSPSDLEARVTSKLQSYLQGQGFDFFAKCVLFILGSSHPFSFFTHELFPDLLTLCFLRAKGDSFVA